MRRNRSIRRVAGIAAALVLAMGMLMIPAFAEHVDVWDDSVPTDWDPQPTGGDANTNNPGFWKLFGLHEEGEGDWVCHKIDQGFDSFTLTDSGLESGNVWRLLVVKAGSGPNENELHWDPEIGESFQHSGTGDVSHLILCQRPEPEPEPNVTVTFTKIWDGDDEGDATASLLVDGEAHEFGAVIDVTDEQGETLSLVEVVEGLPDNCTYTTDLPASFDVPVATDADIHVDIDVTNTVECEIEELEEPSVTVTFTKIWAGAAEGDATATLLVDDEAHEFGAVIDVTDEQGETLSLAEVVEGLPEDCTYSSDLPASFDVPVADDEDIHVDIDVTNTVTCAGVGVLPEEEEEPPAAPVVEEKEAVEPLAELPRTGVSAEVLGLLSALLLGLGLTTLAGARLAGRRTAR